MLLVYGPRSADLRLRARPPADAAPVRAGDRPAPRGRRGAGAGARAGAGRRARVVPRPGVHRRRQAVLGGAVRAAEGRDRPWAATIRRSPGCTTPAAMVAGGSIRAMEAILRGEVDHAFHPGGGLHHAMPERASGFCIYDDVALAIARARRDGPAGALRRSRRPSRRRGPGDPLGRPGRHDGLGPRVGHDALPGERASPTRWGRGPRPGPSVNVPLEPTAGSGSGSTTLRTLLPELAAAFGPGHRRQPARRRFARVGPARAPAR